MLIMVCKFRGFFTPSAKKRFVSDFETKKCRCGSLVFSKRKNEKSPVPLVSRREVCYNDFKFRVPWRERNDVYEAGSQTTAYRYGYHFP
jgi:hypothetical protein